MSARIFTARPDGTFEFRLPGGTCPDCERTLGEGSSMHGWASYAYTSCSVHASTSRRVTAQGHVLALSIPMAISMPGSAAQPDPIVALARDVNNDLAFMNDSARLASVQRFMADPHAWDVPTRASAARTDAMAAQGLLWALHAFAPDEMRQWRSVGVDMASEAALWRDLGFQTYEVPAWHAAGVVPAREAYFLTLIDVTPKTLPAGVTTFRELVFADAARLPRTAEWGALVKVCSPRFAGTGRKRGQSPAAVAALAAALTANEPAESVLERDHYGDPTKGLEFTLAWSKDRCSTLNGVAQQVGTADWADVAAGLRIDLPLDEAIERARTGRDMEQIRLMAALVA